MSSSSGKRPALGPDSANRKRILIIASVTATVLTLLVTLAAAQLPLFDSSPRVLLPPPGDGRFSLRHALASAILRWDAFHFAAIAKEGYAYENQWAFFPGAPFVMRTAGKLVNAVLSLFGASSSASEWEEVLLGGLSAAVLSVLSTLRLYELSVVHLGSSDAAFLAALLSLLPSSPVTLRLAGYSEPFFTYLSYTGMLFCARNQWLLATGSFALACTFRSNGIFLSGFILWGILVEPILERRKVSLWRALYAVALSALTLSPFLYHQYTAYRVFCTEPSESAPAPSWCNAVPPSVYTYVQAKYWNGGFMRYWTVAQIPNFVIAAPPLALLFVYTARYLRAAFFPRLRELVLESRQSRKDIEGSDTPCLRTPSPFLHPSLAPHAIHALIMSLLLLFASHTQIVLRQAAAMPAVYWAAAWLLVEHPRAGRWWVGWSVVWGAVSCVLWAAFLPPA
ncbi:mannosyltransferase [Lentinus tigrinus ALCF2SS1-7]|uniref:GPI mannosyltransferase 2 n=1 Tax=Lentinus tigrinus ALCF2SS1-6 TaxID=1328759 RepID=A0A5C2S094_9APHY|nr:mannosyltransferase [Lentinus tigrinus ALCF2SS1-6]RPD71145.1 mannosyltransferase [Lentinus tigrinus ALCF2SS1-7]